MSRHSDIAQYLVNQEPKLFKITKRDKAAEIANKLNSLNANINHDAVLNQHGGPSKQSNTQSKIKEPRLQQKEDIKQVLEGTGVDIHFLRMVQDIHHNPIDSKDQVTTERDRIYSVLPSSNREDDQSLRSENRQKNDHGLNTENQNIPEDVIELDEEELEQLNNQEKQNSKEASLAGSAGKHHSQKKDEGFAADPDEIQNTDANFQNESQSAEKEKLSEDGKFESSAEKKSQGSNSEVQPIQAIGDFENSKILDSPEEQKPELVQEDNSPEAKKGFFEKLVEIGKEAVEDIIN